jgi:nitrite reductase (NADH) small subunit
MVDATERKAPERWHRVCGLDEIPARGARRVEIDGRPIAVFRTSDDRVFALLDRCPHRGGPLSQGIVHGHCVTCPLHDWVIELATGEARAPDEGGTERYPVRLEGSVVLLGVPADAAPQTGANGSPRATRPASAACADGAAADVPAAPAARASDGTRLATAR